MKTINYKKLQFKNEEIKNCCKLLLDNGFRIIKSYFKEDEKQSYFVYSKNDKIAYLQAEYSGIKYSTLHKPCFNFGSGFGLCDEHIINTTIEDLERGFIKYPNWAKGDVTKIEKYKNLDDYLSSRMHKNTVVEIIKNKNHV